MVYCVAVVDCLDYVSLVVDVDVMLCGVVDVFVVIVGCGVYLPWCLCSRVSMVSCEQ